MRVILSLLLFLSVSILHAEQEEMTRVISIEDIAAEFGIIFVEEEEGASPELHRDIPMHASSLTDNEYELFLMLLKKLLVFGKTVMQNGRKSTEFDMPEGRQLVVPLSKGRLREIQDFVDQLAAEKKSGATGTFQLPLFLLGLADLAHNLVGIIEHRFVPGIRTVVADFLQAARTPPSIKRKKRVRFADEVNQSTMLWE